jgi:hypothetical protein
VETFVGEAYLLMTLGSQVYWLEGISKLILKSVMYVGILMPLLNVFIMLLDCLADLCSRCGGREDMLRSWIVHNGKRLAWGNHVIHCGWHDNSQVSVHTSTMVRCNCDHILLQIIAEAC